MRRSWRQASWKGTSSFPSQKGCLERGGELSLLAHVLRAGEELQVGQVPTALEVVALGAMEVEDRHRDHVVDVHPAGEVILPGPARRKRLLEVGDQLGDGVAKNLGPGG